MTLAEDISLLIRVPLFAELATDHLRLLAFSSVRVALPRGQVLFHKGAVAQSGFIIMTGTIDLVDPDAEAALPLGHFGPGVLLGEAALFIETRRPATALAATDSEVVEIDRSLMRRMLTEYPEVAARFHSKLAGRFGATLRDVAQVHTKLDNIRYPAARRS